MSGVALRGTASAAPDRPRRSRRPRHRARAAGLTPRRLPGGTASRPARRPDQLAPSGIPASPARRAPDPCLGVTHRQRGRRDAPCRPRRSRRRAHASRALACGLGRGDPARPPSARHLPSTRRGLAGDQRQAVSRVERLARLPRRASRPRRIDDRPAARKRYPPVDDGLVMNPTTAADPAAISPEQGGVSPGIARLMQYRWRHGYAHSAARRQRLGVVAAEPRGNPLRRRRRPTPRPLPRAGSGACARGLARRARRLAPDVACRCRSLQS
jgi:hypothetical protein